MYRGLVFSIIIFCSINVHAQENQNSLKTKIEGAPSVFKLKTELRSSANSFSDKASISQFRLRLDPSWSVNDWVIGFRQDVKNKFSSGRDNYIFENTRAFVGRTYKADDWQIQPRMEVWLPTNIKDRDKLSYQGSPGAALKIKKKWLNVTSNYELNGKKMLYSESKNNYTDWILCNELRNEIRLTKSVAGNLNIKFDDSWDELGIRSQKYSFEQSLGFSIAPNFDLEVGHVVEKATLANNKEASFVLYNKDLSQLYTTVSYLY